MEETPGEDSDFIEELDYGDALCAVDGTRSGKETKVGVDLFCLGVGDTPVVVSIATRPSMAL